MYKESESGYSVHASLGGLGLEMGAPESCLPLHPAAGSSLCSLVLLPAHSPASSRAQPALLRVTKDVGTLLAAERGPLFSPRPAELPPPSLCILMPAPFFALTGVYHISLVGILPSLA